MTKNERLEQAQALAARPYILFAFLDQTTDDDIVFVATNPELPGCMAQGETIEEAEEVLAEVRSDYIAHLLTNGQVVPEPSFGRLSINSQPAEPFFRFVEPEADRDDKMTDINLQVAVSV